MVKIPRGIFICNCRCRFFQGARTFSRPFCPKFALLFLLVSTVRGLRAWRDDLNVVLFEFLGDDDTKLAQSCTDWLHVQHWYTVVPAPAMRVTLWAEQVGNVTSTRKTHRFTFLLFSFFAVIGTTSVTALAGIHWILFCVGSSKTGPVFLFRPVTRSAAIAAMVWASFAGARRRAM